MTHPFPGLEPTFCSNRSKERPRPQSEKGVKKKTHDAFLFHVSIAQSCGWLRASSQKRLRFQAGATFEYLVKRLHRACTKVSSEYNLSVRSMAVPDPVGPSLRCRHRSVANRRIYGQTTARINSNLQYPG